MLTPTLVGHLRRTGLWELGQRVHGSVVPPACAVVHAAVGRLGRLVPGDVRLKHVYDYQVIWIDPALITRSLKVGEWHRQQSAQPASPRSRWRQWYRLGGGWKNARKHLTRNLHGRFIADGDWDLRTRPLEMRSVINELFVDRRLPRETAEYQKLAAWIDEERFGWTRGCRTRADLDRYFDELISTYERMRNEGYLTQLQLGNDGSDEMRIVIDRNGDPCVFGGGTHRLAIAWVLGIRPVPVLVKRVHSNWVADCQDRFKTSDPAEAIRAGLLELEVATEEVGTDD